MSKSLEDIKNGVTMGEEYDSVNGMALFALDMDAQIARDEEREEKIYNLEERISSLLIQIDHLNEKYDDLMDAYKAEVEQNDGQ